MESETVMDWIISAFMWACIAAMCGWLLWHYLFRPLAFFYTVVGVIVAVCLLAHAVCAPWPSKRRLRNRDRLICPHCGLGRLVRHSYGTATLWSCHACNHLQFEVPR
jgi:hypothetical protein